MVHSAVGIPLHVVRFMWRCKKMIAFCCYTSRTTTRCPFWADNTGSRDIIGITVVWLLLMMIQRMLIVIVSRQAVITFWRIHLMLRKFGPTELPLFHLWRFLWLLIATAMTVLLLQWSALVQIALIGVYWRHVLTRIVCVVHIVAINLKWLNFYRSFSHISQFQWSFFKGHLDKKIDFS